jgi:hypothetical protein
LLEATKHVIHLLCCALLAGALATLLEGKLVLVNAAAGSPKFDCACSLDLLALAASYSFTTKMKVDAVTLLESLEAWVDKQATSLDLSQNLEKLAQSFDSLLKTMDALYQVSVSAVLPLQLRLCCSRFNRLLWHERRQKTCMVAC